VIVASQCATARDRAAWPLADAEFPRRPATRLHHRTVIDDLISGERFLTYLTQSFVPTLTPGDIVIMD
jgi:hypothetical protein